MSLIDAMWDNMYIVWDNLNLCEISVKLVIIRQANYILAYGGEQLNMMERSHLSSSSRLLDE
jgi:hypothetical protein